MYVNLLGLIRYFQFFGWQPCSFLNIPRISSSNRIISKRITVPCISSTSPDETVTIVTDHFPYGKQKTKHDRGVLANLGMKDAERGGE